MHITKLGSTSQATDYSGAVVQDQLYYPWGQEWQMVGAAQEKRFGLLGHRDLTETGLDPTHFRVFSSTQGRWLGRDPIHGPACDPQMLNLYAYVRNTPTNQRDESGAGGQRPGCYVPCFEFCMVFTVEEEGPLALVTCAAACRVFCDQDAFFN